MVCRLSIVFVLIGCMACSSVASDRVNERRDYTIGTHLVLLGTGTPNAEPDRSGPAVAVLVNGTSYLVDAGPGIVRRAMAAAKAGVGPLSMSSLRILFLTHLHSDHTLGLPDLIFTPWVLERDVPLEVYGPQGTAHMVEHLLAAYEADVRVRLEGLEPANPNGYKVDVHEIHPSGFTYEDANVRVTAFPVEHGDWENSFAYRFESADRIIVISGDAVPSEAMVEQCAGCDVLVHEVYSQQRLEQRPQVWQRYHASSHTSTVELAELAARARPHLLVLYHQLLWGATADELLSEITGRYDGRVVFGRDLDVF